ncbi:hypothetical protein I302_104891 [Kwoniella bestiolae CBS 10118]|uniref:Uncharacterized protein n=1 Tax=Kwoniella bestiolae CBS 10118 TaxID=1296100 RepID=A0A1B9FRI4_9TREE|nr:hypothetical protein I302_09038 [Kwoniella bestiolae CBS 10118]OCF21362.1 hypothetical protein I302_09038 [Kwoniella bestiolae CBS 10118]
MAIPTSPQSQQQTSDDAITILNHVAKTNKLDCGWPTLKSTFQSTLTTHLELYHSKGPLRPYRPPSSSFSPPVGPEPEPIKLDPSEEEGEKPPSESLLLSPSPQTPEASTQPNPVPRSIDVEPSATPSAGRLESLTTQDDLKPSTTGGLVIPPFPPLDPNRRRTQISGPSYSGGTIISSPRSINGMRGGAQRIVTIGPSVLEDEYDEETTIGGKVLRGWMELDEAQRELDKVRGMLDDMVDPPFTIQRLSELLLEPTKYYSTFGKFIRAVEKLLLVTTNWTEPSYTPQPISSFTLPSTSSSKSTENGYGYDLESTMPPGSTTPMFSPIPFLSSNPPSDDLGSSSSNGLGGGNKISLDDGLMSPLMLEESGIFGSSANPRSPTPEPEESEPTRPEGDKDVDMEVEEDERVKVKSPDTPIPPRPKAAQGQYTQDVEHESSDPGHQSYLGRVDELDTGPITSPSTPTSQDQVKDGQSPLKGKGKNGHGHGHGPEEIPVPGTGEGGNMTPHGMSEKPVPISSTTVLDEDKEKEKRTIAGLPRSSSEKSLRERFVSASADEGEGKKEVE